jgi:hypothetical protein
MNKIHSFVVCIIFSLYFQRSFTAGFCQYIEPGHNSPCISNHSMWVDYLRVQDKNGCSIPCMGCGRYTGDPDKHFRGISEDGRLRCFPCRLRGFRGIEDNWDLIYKINYIGVVFRHPLCPSLQGWYTCIEDPRRLTLEEMATLTEIENPFYDAALGEKYPAIFGDVFPQNPKKVTILSSHMSKVLEMRRIVKDVSTPPSLKPLKFTSPCAHDHQQSGSNDDSHEIENQAGDLVSRHDSPLHKNLLSQFLSLDTNGPGQTLKAQHTAVPSGDIELNDSDEWTSHDDGQQKRKKKKRKHSAV